MEQWMNLYHNKNFVNQTLLSLLYEKSGAILLMLVDFMAGRHAASQPASQPDKL